MRVPALFTLLAVAAIGPASAVPGKPRLSINVREGSFSGLEGLDPSVQWSTSGKGPNDYFDYEVGFDLAIRPTDEVTSLARSAYGVVKRDDVGGGWGLSARADAEVGGDSKVEAVDLDLRAGKEEWDLGFKLMGTAGKRNSLNKVEVTKGFDVLDGKLTVNPRFDVKKTKGDVVLSFDGDKTGVQIVASPDDQKVTISRMVTDDNVIAPSVTTGGEVALQWRRDMGDGKSLVTTLKPNDSISVKWSDGAWIADVDAPLDGISLDNINVSVKRKVDFL